MLTIICTYKPQCCNLNFLKEKVAAYSPNSAVIKYILRNTCYMSCINTKRTVIVNHIRIILQNYNGKAHYSQMTQQ